MITLDHVQGFLNNIRSKDEQKLRKPSESNYISLILEMDSRDCDGPMSYPTQEYLITEEELPLMLVSHFGSHGWQIDSNGKHAYQYQKTDEGFHRLDATILYPIAESI